MKTTVGELLSIWDNLPIYLYRLGKDGKLFPRQVVWPDNQVGDCVVLLMPDETSETHAEPI